MNTFVRWGKFNLVGAMGMVVQLTALALFDRAMHGHYLYASAAAVELTLLHNFVWHWHFTWRDRKDSVTPIRPFVRFHLSSGLISLLGNLALMQLLVHQAHLPLLVSNLAAILCCSIANFCVGNRWAFARRRKTEPPRESRIAGQHGDLWSLQGHMHEAGSIPAINRWMYLNFDPSCVRTMLKMSGLQVGWKEQPGQKLDNNEEHWTCPSKDGGDSDETA